MNSEKDKTHNLERIYLNRDSVDEMENMILIGRHLERYALTRQFLWGSVLDIAAGVGYGSYLIAKNPDIEHVHGVDSDPEAVSWATSNFGSERISFSLDTVEKFTGSHDFLVSLETIEHLSDPGELHNLVQRCGIKEAIISFPGKKTTHYNKHHKWDIQPSDVLRLFANFVCVNQINLYDSIFIHLVRHERKRAKRNTWKF